MLRNLHLCVYVGTNAMPCCIICQGNLCCMQMFVLVEGIRQYDSSHSDNVNIAAEHQEPAEVLSQLDNTSNSPVYGEYKCC